MSDPYTTPEPSKSVLLTIDMQNDFTLDDGAAPIAGTQDVVPAIGAALEAFRRARRPIIHVVRLYSEDGGNVDPCRRKLIEGGASIVRPGTDGAELVAALKPDPACRLKPDVLLAGQPQQLAEREWVLYKPRWSAFHATPLADMLHEMAATTVVVSGCNFPNCPRATVYDASNRDYRVVIVADGISGLYDRGIDELAGIGVTLFQSGGVAAWLDRMP